MAAGVNLQFNTGESQKIILVAMTVVVMVAIVEKFKDNSIQNSLIQIFVGAFVATTLLLLLSYVMPEFAVGLAAVAAVSMVLTNGQPFWDAINTVVGQKPKAAPALPLQAQINAEQPTGTYTSTPLAQG